MNCEHIKSNKMMEIMETYDVKNVKHVNGNTYKFDIFNSTIEVDVHNFYKTLQHYKKIRTIIKEEHELLIDTYIENNYIFLKIKTQDGIIYTTNLKGYSKIVNSRHRFIDTVNKNGHTLLSTYINAKDKVLIDFNCGHEPNNLTANSYLNGARCPICSGKKILPYVNDVYTLRKDLLKYFINEEDAIGMCCSNREKRMYQCPCCKTPRLNTLGNIDCFGFSCYECKDGISYPEKMMYKILSIVNEPYEMHKYFEWCKFELDDKEHYHYGIYDFVLKNKKVIIEMDGKFHETDNYMNKKMTKEFSQQIDKIKDDLALKHGYRVIRINCCYKNIIYRFNYIKENIIEKLGTIIDLSNIDWNELEKDITKPFINDICELWNEGKSAIQISEETKINKTSVIEYLKIGNSLQLCEYTSAIAIKRRDEQIASKFYKYIKALNNNNDIIGVFYNINKYIENYHHIKGVKLRKSRIREIVNTKYATDGLHYETITESEYNELLQSNLYISDLPILDMEVSA